jgi:hypothetical protein
MRDVGAHLPTVRDCAYNRLMESDEVYAAYTDQRGKAMSASSFRLRWLERRLQRSCGQHSSTGLARLKAIRDELRDRREGTRGWTP